MQPSENQPQRRLRVVLLFRGEPLEEKSFLLGEPGLLRRRPTCVSIGDGRGDTFAVPPMGLPPSFPLLRAVGDEFVLRLSQSMVGRICIAGERLTVAEFFASRRGISVPGETVPQRDQVLGASDWGVVTAEPTGAVAFFFQFLPPMEGAADLRPKGRLAGVPYLRDPFLRQALAISAAVHLSVLLLARAAWDPGSQLALDAAQAARLVRVTADPRAVDRARATKQPEGGGFPGMAAQLAHLHDRRRYTPRPLLSDELRPAQLPSAAQGGTPGGAAPQLTAVPEPGTPSQVAPAPGTPSQTQQPPAAPAAAAPAPPAPPPAPADSPLTAAAKVPPPPSRPDAAPPKAPPPQGTSAGTKTQATTAAKLPPPAAKAQAAGATPKATVPGTALTAQAGDRPIVLSGLPPSAPRRSVSVLSGAPIVPMAQGALSTQQLDKVISTHQAEIESCYLREAPPTGSLSGRIVLVWSIDGSGKVTAARIESTTLRSPPIEACVIQQALRWRFPAARAATRDASIPFIFDPTSLAVEQAERRGAAASARSGPLAEAAS